MSIKNTVRLLGLALVHKPTADIVCTLPTELFTEHELVIRDALEYQINNNVNVAVPESDPPDNTIIITDQPFLTREALLCFFDKRRSPANKAALIILYNRCLSNECKLADVPTIVEQLKHEATKQQFISELQGHSEPNTDYDPIQFQFPTLPLPVKQISDYLSTTLETPGSIKTFFAAIHCLNAVVGKRLRFMNQGSYHYCNLFTVILDKSGSNKTGLYEITSRLLSNTPSHHTSTAMTMEAFLEYFGDTVTKDRDESRSHFHNKVQSKANEHRLELEGYAISVDEFRAFIKTMIKDNEVIKHGQYFCRLTGGHDIEYNTVSKGMRVVGDPCFSMLGFSQADNWNSEIRTPAFQTGGLSGRLIPINAVQMSLTDYQTDNVDESTAQHALEALATVAQLSSNVDKRIDVTFGATADHPDPLGEAKEQLMTEAVRVVRFAAEYPEQCELLQNKILIQAAKLSALLAYADAVGQQMSSDNLSPWTAIDVVDASPWIQFSFRIITAAHISNTYHVAALTQQAENMEQVLKTVRMYRGKQPGVTVADVVKRTDFKKYDVQGYLDMLVDLNSIRPIKSTRTTFYRAYRPL